MNNTAGDSPLRLVLLIFSSPPAVFSNRLLWNVCGLYTRASVLVIISYGALHIGKYKINAALKFLVSAKGRNKVTEKISLL